jgi:hypothetical protein
LSSINNFSVLLLVPLFKNNLLGLSETLFSLEENGDFIFITWELGLDVINVIHLFLIFDHRCLSQYPEVLVLIDPSKVVASVDNHSLAIIKHDNIVRGSSPEP